MKIKTTFISSSFENNVYPKGIACVQCTVQTKDSEVSFMFIRKSDENTVESFVENDNICQKFAIQKTLKIIKYIENYDVDELGEIPQHSEVNYRNDMSYRKEEKRNISYKQKVIELVNLLDWSIEKLSKFVQKYSKKKLSELTENEWAKIYDYLSKMNTTYNVNNEKIDDAESEIIKPEEWEEII
ncbi:MAG: hypothetical protein N2169_04805 [bacterium]|nr:hypothetical protein [bacterium]